MVEESQLKMTLMQSHAWGQPSEKILEIDNLWSRLAKTVALSGGSLMAKASPPVWLGWLDIGEYKPAYFSDAENLVLSGWNTNSVFSYFAQRENTVCLVTPDAKYRAQVSPGHALITPYDADEASMSQQPLFMDDDMPWWEEPTAPSLAKEIKGFAKAIYREARNMCADVKTAGEGAEPFFTPLKLSARLEGPTLSIEAWMYYGTLCKLNQEENTDGSE